MTIAISIITHNRYDVFKKTYKEIKKFMPKGAKLFVVDDGSEIPVKEADFRFDKAQGIAAAKNKAFELADGYDYHFAFDDDVYPIKKDWHLEYINTGLNHLCFTFDRFSNGKHNGRRKIGQEGNIVRYFEPCGLMNFYTKKCFDTVGGMDVEFGAWSYEHVSHSMRIHNAGLTPYPFMDIENSLDLFYSFDWDQTTVRSVDVATRARLARINQQKYQREIKSSAYIPYKQATGIILTSYFTGVTDPQRGEKWEADIDKLKALSDSCKSNNTELHVLDDCFGMDDIDDCFGNENHIHFPERIESKINPYFQRWFSYRDYLKANTKYNNIWLCDATDVEVLKNPFQIIQPGKIYCGWEKDFIGCQWMHNHHKSNFSQNFIKSNTKTPLLNAGVIGGRYDMVMEFLDRFCDMYDILPEKEACATDMSLFNWVLYSHFLGRIETGLKICTEFKAFDKVNRSGSIFRHK